MPNHTALLARQNAMEACISLWHFFVRLQLNNSHRIKEDLKRQTICGPKQSSHKDFEASQSYFL